MRVGPEAHSGECMSGIVQQVARTEVRNGAHHRRRHDTARFQLTHSAPQFRLSAEHDTEPNGLDQTAVVEEGGIHQRAAHVEAEWA